MTIQVQDNQFYCTACGSTLRFHSWRSLSILGKCTACGRVFNLDDLAELAQVKPQATQLVLPPEDYAEQ